MNISDRVSNSKESSTVKIADITKNLIEQGEDVRDFSAGRALEPTPEYIIEEAYQAMCSGDTHQTKAKGTNAFRNAVAAKLARENNIQADPSTEIIATMGVKQGLTISLLSIINPGDEVIVEDPCFVSYKQLIQYLGGVPVSVPLREKNNFRWDKDELEAYITSKTKAIIFNTPHNPTGVVHSKKDLADLAEVVQKHNLFVLSDEVYERVVWGDKRHVNLAGLPGMKDRTITLVSLTKSFSMGGWRIGFVYANETIIRSLEKLQQHLITSCNSFVQTAAVKAFGEPPRSEVIAFWKEWEEKCEYVTEALNNISGIRCGMPEGAFYAWANIKDIGISSQQFTEELLEQQKVAVIHGSSFGEFGEGYFRMTCVKSKKDLQEGIARIENYVKRLT